VIRRLAAAFVLVLAAAAATAQPARLPGSSVEMVSVDVSVIAEGRAVPGLTAERFDVRDEGTRRAVELVAAGDVPLHLLLVMDASDSVAGERGKRLVRSAQALFPDLGPADRVGLIAFSEEVRLLADVESSAPAVRAMLARLGPGGGTSLRDALWAALKRAETVRGRQLVLLFTDGTDTSSWLTEDAVLALARESDSVIHVVSTADRKGLLNADPFLSRLTAITGGRLWEASDADEQELAVRRALAEMRSRYVLRFERPPDAKAGWHRLEVRLKGAKGDVLARRGYYVPAAPQPGG